MILIYNHRILYIESNISQRIKYYILKGELW